MLLSYEVVVYCLLGRVMMQYIYKLFHQYDQSTFVEKYTKRTTSETVVWLDLSIKPINQPNIYELYYIPTNEMLHRIAEIYKVSGELNLNYHKLPIVAKDQFILESLVEELYKTNELEGVKSSKAEIATSVKSIQLKKTDKKRFDSMIKSYRDLVSRKVSLPTSAKDIRSIYDNITEGEISETNLPDGETFRKEVVKVLAKSGTNQIIHRGVQPESMIVTSIKQLLKFLNKSDDVPPIIKVAIGHYYFGYIHPFYDGNGRTSRFISSLYLAETLGEIPALSLSKGAYKMVNQYLNAFDRTNRMMNQGEMNFFIDTFLKIILNTLTEMNGELKERVQLLNLVVRKLETDSQIENKNYFNMMFILVQHYFFQYSDGLTVQELASMLELSEMTVRRIAKKLLEMSYIKQEGLRPAFYSLNESYLETK